jgi:circadian clock protein KaiC
MGRVRRAISIIKKRSGPHEDTIREFQITRHGFTLGGALDSFEGILRGVPVYRGKSEPLLKGSEP